MNIDIDNVYLTPRETDIIKILAESKTIKQASLELDISQWTAYNTLSRVLRRFKSNKYDLIYKVAKMGVIDELAT